MERWFADKDISIPAVSSCGSSAATGLYTGHYLEKSTGRKAEPSAPHWKNTPLGEVILTDIAPKNEGKRGPRQLAAHPPPKRRLVKQQFFQDRSVHRPEGWAIRDLFAMLEETALTAETTTAWLETLLEENAAHAFHNNRCSSWCFDAVRAHSES
ncbi:hypothetical protein GCM10023213_25940 [Prosthecobacter algae]|uniref:Transposase n=1 Tax=Prosthecobacter algae TaxID=1144682 RepID=A0ABP9P6G2_9BACT